MLKLHKIKIFYLYLHVLDIKAKIFEAITRIFSTKYEIYSWEFL